MREERETSLPIDVDYKHAFWVGFNGVMEKAAGYIGVVAECVCAHVHTQGLIPNVLKKEKGKKYENFDCAQPLSVKPSTLSGYFF